MTLSQLDPTVALLSIDLQNGILRLSTTADSHAVARTVGAVASAFRATGRPVVVVTVAGAPRTRIDRTQAAAPVPDDFAEPAAELDVQPQDIRIVKRTWGAFTGTDLREQLEAHGITQVVIGGIYTSIGVESTARFAQELGYHVVILSDAVADTVPEAERSSLSNILPRVAELATSAEVIAALQDGEGS